MNMNPTTTLEPPVTIHRPLAPLSAEEIQRAIEMLRESGRISATMRVVMATLQEPEKSAVLAWEPGISAPPREAFIMLLDNASNTTYEAIVNLDIPEISSWFDVPNVHPPVMLDEFFECERALRQDPVFQDAVRKRGVSDFGLLMIDPWSAGAYHSDHSAHADRRLVRALTWVRSGEGENGYAHPLEGLLALFDLNSMTLVHLSDTSVVAIPPQPGNYAPGFHAKLRTAPAPLEIAQPEGPGFAVNDHRVTWQGWSFDVGFTPREGLVLHQIAYTEDDVERPIIYRASMVDMIVPYGDPHENHARKNAFDCGEYGIGMLANSLALGCDCLGVIRYFDAHMVTSRGEPLTIKNAICLHEEDYGFLWKHTDWRTSETELRRSRRLVISSVSTVGNYEYGFFWYFYLDGTIQFEIKLTGIMNTGALAPGETRKYGALMAPGLYAAIHQHIFSIRLDMQIDGSANSVQEVNTFAEEMNDTTNPYGNAFYAKSSTLTHECGRDMDMATARYWKVINPNVRNALGDPTAYKIMMGENAFPFVHAQSSVRRRAGYMDHHLWVTPYEKSEAFAVGDYPNQRQPDIADGLPAWIQQHRSVENKDLVCWITLNSHHVPRPEDWPVMPCSYIGFHLKPVGFFSRNPAIDLPPALSKESIEVGREPGDPHRGCCGGA